MSCIGIDGHPNPSVWCTMIGRPKQTKFGQGSGFVVRSPYLE